MFSVLKKLANEWNKIFICVKSKHCTTFELNNFDLFQNPYREFMLGCPLINIITLKIHHLNEMER